MLEPNSPYSAAKAGGDLIARAYAKTLRPEHLDHPLQQQLRALPLPREGHSAVRHQPARRQESAALRRGTNVRDWLFVADHCRGIQLVVEQGAPGEFYNIGGGRELSNQELTELLLDATGRDWAYVQHIVDPRGGGHDLRYSVDYSKIAALGYAPQMTFEEGLALTVDWYRTTATGGSR